MALNMQKGVSKLTNPGKQEQDEAPQFIFQIEGRKQNKQLYKDSIFLLLECMVPTGMTDDEKAKKTSFFKEKFAEVTEVAGKIIVISNGPTILSKTVAMHHKNLLNGDGLTAEGKTLCHAIIEDWKATFSPIYQDNFMDWDESSKLENEKIGTILDDIISSEIADESTALSQAIKEYLSQAFVRRKMSHLVEQRGKLQQLQQLKVQLQTQTQTQPQLQKLQQLTHNLVDQQYVLDPMTDVNEVERTAKDYLTLELQTFARWCFKWQEDNVFMCYDHDKYQMAILNELHTFLASDKFKNVFEEAGRQAKISPESVPKLSIVSPLKINATRRKNNVVPFEKKERRCQSAPQTTSAPHIPQKKRSFSDSKPCDPESFLKYKGFWCAFFDTREKTLEAGKSPEHVDQSAAAGLDVMSKHRHSHSSSGSDSNSEGTTSPLSLSPKGHTGSSN